MKAVAACVRVAEGRRGVRPAWLGRVKRPVDLSIRPWYYTLGKTTGSEAADSDEASPKGVEAT
jgi:hypothetical protein